VLLVNMPDTEVDMSSISSRWISIHRLACVRLILYSGHGFACKVLITTRGNGLATRSRVGPLAAVLPPGAVSLVSGDRMKTG
jgi:hypothetical protein